MNYSRREYAMGKLLSVQGFSLVELVIVILIIGIVALTGLPMLNGVLEHSKLKGATEEVVNALQYAQMTAMTSGRQTRVVIAPHVEKIGVRQFNITADLFGGGDELVAADVESGSYEFMEYPLKKGVDYEIKFPDEDRFREVDITGSDFSVATPLYFDSLGSPSHGGTATLSVAGFQMVVTVDDLTGKVSVSE